MHVLKFFSSFACNISFFLWLPSLSLVLWFQQLNFFFFHCVTWICGLASIINPKKFLVIIFQIFHPVLVSLSFPFWDYNYVHTILFDILSHSSCMFHPFLFSFYLFILQFGQLFWPSFLAHWFFSLLMAHWKQACSLTLCLWFHISMRFFSAVSIYVLKLSLWR